MENTDSLRLADKDGNIPLTVEGEHVGLRFSNWSLELASMAAGRSVQDLLSDLQVIPKAFRSITYLVYGAYQAWCEQYGHEVKFNTTHIAHALESDVEYTILVTQDFCLLISQMTEKTSRYLFNPN